MRNEILNHDLFKECLGKIKCAERDRAFCGHQMSHFLDVARLAMILSSQENIEIEEEHIYAAALLHDIGRFQQYEDGTPHEISSARIARIILKDLCVRDKITGVIVDAIQCHRTKSVETEKNLRGILYRADKMSRSCFACDMEELCDWKKEKKNESLRY